MPAHNIICLVIDGLRASSLGTYGAAGCDTPAFDRLASESFVFDQFLIDHTDLSAIYRGFWQGLSPILPESAGVDLISLPAFLEQQGYQTLLITDEPVVAEHMIADEFQSVHLLSCGDEESAEDISQMQIARLFAELLEAIESTSATADSPTFIWLHAQGMFGPWDGPLELRQSLADEEDPTPPEFTAVPSEYLKPDYDPDQLLGISQAYAGQVMALDDCLAALLDFLETEGANENTTLLVLGSRGFPVGEHLRVGLADESLYSELLHVPFIWRLPGSEAAGFRSNALIQPCDIAVSIANSVGVPLTGEDQLQGKNLLPLVHDDSERLREAIMIHGRNGERALRTGLWHMRSASQTAIELYVKPDDRWEANEISDRCPEVVTAMQAAAEALVQSIDRRDEALPELDSSLLSEP